MQAKRKGYFYVERLGESKAYEQHDVAVESKADADFHLAIAEASHNLINLHLSKSLLTVLQTSAHSSIQKMLDNNIARVELMHQHTAIYKAIVDRQPDTAREACKRHIRYVEDLLRDLSREQDRKERSQRRYLD